MKKKFLIYFIGNFGSKFLNLIMIPIFTIYVNSKEFGEYDYWMTISNLVIIFLGVNIQDAAYMNIIKYRNDNKLELDSIVNKLLKTVIYQSFMIVIIYLLLVFLYGYDIFILLLFILVLLNNLHSFFSQGLARGFEENKIMAVSSIVLSSVTVLFTLISIWINESLDHNFNYASLLIISQIIGYLSSVIFLMFYMNKRIFLSNIMKEYLSFLEVLTWIKFSFPLVINSLGWWVIYLSGRIIVVKFLGESENGIFSIANRFPSIIFMLNTIFTLVWQDFAISIRKNNDNSNIYNINLRKFSHVQFISLILFTIIFYYVSPFLLRNEYISGNVYVPLLMYATAFSGFASFYSAFYFSTGKSNGAIPSSIISAIVFICITLSLITTLGLYAVAIATIVSYFIMLYLRTIEFKRKLNINFPWGLITIYSLLFSIIYFVLYF